jgi:hypothetical protein
MSSILLAKVQEAVKVDLMTLPDGVAEREDYEFWGKRFVRNWVRRKSFVL